MKSVERVNLLHFVTAQWIKRYFKLIGRPLRAPENMKITRRIEVRFGSMGYCFARDYKRWGNNEGAKLRHVLSQPQNILCRLRDPAVSVHVIFYDNFYVSWPKFLSLVNDKNILVNDFIVAVFPNSGCR